MDVSNPGVGSMHRPAAGRHRLCYLVTEIGDRFTQPSGKLNCRLPPAQLTGATNVRLASLGIILGESRTDEVASASGETNDRLGQIEDGQFLGVTEIDRSCLPRHQDAIDTFDKVGNIAEATCLGSIAKDRNVLTAKRLGDEARNGPAIFQPHARAVS